MLSEGHTFVGRFPDKHVAFKKHNAFMSCASINLSLRQRIASMCPDGWRDAINGYKQQLYRQPWLV